MSMNTTKELLPAINSLYKIKLKTKEVNSLCNNMDSLFDKVTKELPEDDAQYNLKRKLTKDTLRYTWYVTRKNNIVLVSSAKDCHWNKSETIELTKLSEDNMERYDHFIKDGESRYVVGLDESNFSLRSIQAIFKTLTTDDLYRLGVARML